MHPIILATHDAYVGRERTGLLDSYASRLLHTLSIRNEIMKYEILWRMNQVQQLDKVLGKLSHMLSLFILVLHHKILYTHKNMA